jgi:hypothetical protein
MARSQNPAGRNWLWNWKRKAIVGRSRLAQRFRADASNWQLAIGKGKVKSKIKIKIEIKT